MELYPKSSETLSSWIAGKIASNSHIDSLNAEQYEKDAKKLWEKFYKRNGDRFFKDRHYLDKEFPELLSLHSPSILEAWSFVFGLRLSLGWLWCGKHLLSFARDFTDLSYSRCRFFAFGY